jgi:hypothetical protein
MLIIHLERAMVLLNQVGGKTGSQGGLLRGRKTCKKKKNPQGIKISQVGAVLG